MASAEPVRLLTVAGLLLIGLAASSTIAAGFTGPSSADARIVVASASSPAAVSENESIAGSGFEIRWQSVDGGATQASGGSYELRGTVGQVDADPAHPAQSLDYDHIGGFWTVLEDPSDVLQIQIFRDRFED